MFTKVLRALLTGCLALQILFVTPVHAINGDTGRANQDGSFGQTHGKESLERLTNLVLASEASAAAAGDLSNLAKLDSHLQDLVSAHLSGTDAVQAAETDDLTVAEDETVLVDVYVNGPLDQAAGALAALGMQVAATNQKFGVVEGYLPVGSVLAAASLDRTQAFLPVMAFGTDTGSVTSEGDAAHNGPAARALGTNGAGVVVGVISDSMNQVGKKVAGSKASGDLPASVTVLHDDTYYPSDEGRAMAEIIYDTAPGITSMYFDSGTASGAAGKANAIKNLVSHGVDIIADDIYYLEEPMFQDGMVADAVDYAYNAGVAYFSSAGNRARQSYESPYRTSTLYPGDHDFDPGSGQDWFQTVATVPSGGYILLTLQWDDPWGKSAHDFDLYLGNTSTMALLSYAESDNIRSGLPVETIYWYNNTGASVAVGLEIYRYSGSTTAYLKYIANRPISEYNTSSPAINPDAASARGSMAVAAVDWMDSGLNDPESYSSRGPSTRYFDTNGVRLTTPDVRQKPNVAGADCVSTSNNFDGNIGFSGGTFCGTSAATPSMAGVAALVLGDNPDMTPSVLYSVLANSANTIDCSASGNPDNDCGYGFVLANDAVSWARTLPALDVYVGGVKQGTHPLPTANATQITYPGLNNGPVRVSNTGVEDVVSSQRVVWGVGFDELMGFPADQLTNEYLFPYYNNVAMNSQLRIGNTGNVPADVDVYIGGAKMNLTSYNLGVGESMRINYAGVNSGPVRVVTNTPGATILPTMRVIWGSGYDELMGYPANQLTTDYLFPWYNNNAMNSQLRIGNTGNVPVDVDVYIGGAKVNDLPYTIPVGGSIRESYPGYNDGPVEVVTNTPGASIITTMRVLWGRGYDELMGFPASSLTNEYVFPLYSNVSLDSQLRIGNTGGVPANVDVYIGNTKLTSTPYNIPVGGSLRIDYDNTESGPLRVVTTTPGASILATERLIYGTTGYDEMMGFASNQLTTEYLFPWYNNNAMISRINVALP